MTRYTRQQFIDLISPHAMRVQQKTGVPASVLIAQAVLESDNGNSELARNANNLFGIKATDRTAWNGSTYSIDTTEYTNGVAHRVNDPFRQYNSIEESIEDYVNYLQTREISPGQLRYAEAFNNTNNPARFVEELRRGGYATDPNYTQKVTGLIDRHNLNQYVEQAASGASPRIQYQLNETMFNQMAAQAPEVMLERAYTELLAFAERQGHAIERQSFDGLEGDARRQKLTEALRTGAQGLIDSGAINKDTRIMGLPIGSLLEARQQQVAPTQNGRQTPSAATGTPESDQDRYTRARDQMQANGSDDWLERMMLGLIMALLTGDMRFLEWAMSSGVSNDGRWGGNTYDPGRPYNGTNARARAGTDGQTVVSPLPNFNANSDTEVTPDEYLATNKLGREIRRKIQKGELTLSQVAEAIREHPDARTMSPIEMVLAYEQAMLGQGGTQGNNRGGAPELFQRYNRGNSGDPWCAFFVDYSSDMFMPGLMDQSDPGMAKSNARWAQQHGAWRPKGSGYIPQPGDLIVFGRSGNNSLSGPGHVGRVHEVKPDGTIITIEGNIGADDIGYREYNIHNLPGRVLGFADIRAIAKARNIDIGEQASPERMQAQARAQGQAALETDLPAFSSYSATDLGGGTTGRRNLERIGTLHPEVRPIVAAAIKELHANGQNVLIGSALRGQEEQDAAFRRGNSGVRYGGSYHNYGLAVDIHWAGRDMNDTHSEAWKRDVVPIMRKYGMVWGNDPGATHLVDNGGADPMHFQFGRKMPIIESGRDRGKPTSENPIYAQLAAGQRYPALNEETWRQLYHGNPPAFIQRSFARPEPAAASPTPARAPTSAPARMLVDSTYSTDALFGLSNEALNERLIALGVADSAVIPGITHRIPPPSANPHAQGDESPIRQIWTTLKDTKLNGVSHVTLLKTMVDTRTGEVLFRGIYHSGGAGRGAMMGMSLHDMQRENEYDPRTAGDAIIGEVINEWDAPVPRQSKERGGGTSIGRRYTGLNLRRDQGGYGTLGRPLPSLNHTYGFNVARLDGQDEIVDERTGYRTEMVTHVDMNRDGKTAGCNGTDEATIFAEMAAYEYILQRAKNPNYSHRSLFDEHDRVLEPDTTWQLWRVHQAHQLDGPMRNRDLRAIEGFELLPRASEISNVWNPNILRQQEILGGRHVQRGGFHFSQIVSRDIRLGAILAAGDSNNDRVLSEDEAQDLYRQLKASGVTVTKEDGTTEKATLDTVSRDLEESGVKVDTNNNGEVSEDELTSGLSEAVQKTKTPAEPERAAAPAQ